MAIGPSAAQVITQNKTVLQALRWPEQRVCNAHTDIIHPLRGERLPYVRACRWFFFFLLFSCWLRSFSVLPKAVLFFRLSLTGDNLARKVQIFKANVTIQAEELVTQRGRIFEASTHFKWHLHSFLQFFCYKQTKNLILHSTEHLKSPWHSVNIWSPNEYRINPQGWTAKPVRNHPCYKSHRGNLAAGQLKPGHTSLLVL